MDKNKSNVFFNYFNAIAENYIKFTRESKNFRCKLVGCHIDPKTQKSELDVLINGIKNQIIRFDPEELVTNDEMIQEFSQHDVRAITFYAFHKKNHNPQTSSTPIYKVYGQEFINNKTIFIIRQVDGDHEYRKSSHELYSDSSLLKKFKFEDLIIILTTAIQEQTIEDMEEA